VNNAKKAFGAIARISTEKDQGLTNEQKNFLDGFFKDYINRTQTSKRFTQDARQKHADPRVVTGFRPELKEVTYPVVVKKSQDQYLWDLDENCYIDMTCGFGSNFFGNGNAHIKKLVTKQLEEGIEIGPSTH
jgi:glutamate-1-semialdehyde aminotransferase